MRLSTVNKAITAAGLNLELIEGLGNSAPYRLGNAERDAMIDIINEIYLKDI